MFVKMEARPESGAPRSPGGMARLSITQPCPPPGSDTQTPAVQRWPCCHTALPQMEQTVPVRVNGTWHWAHAAISQGHYLALRPGGLIQG